LDRAILESDAKIRTIVSDPGALQRYEDSKAQVNSITFLFFKKINAYFSF
jgi:hypothetical protein